MIPEAIAVDVERAASSAAGRAVRIVEARAVGGGCISAAARVELQGDGPAFLKWAGSRNVADGFFRAEAVSLDALHSAGAIRVPAVRAVADRWLLLEWLEPGPPTDATWARLGRELAALHQTRGPAFGMAHDNFIGSLPQANGWMDSWSAFWRERRLEPQLRHAYDRGHFNSRDRSRFDSLLARLNDLLGATPDAGASLLHGDLWNGNVHALANGSPALIDPSTYYGHREVDLAMAELFGGFARSFFDAYIETWPLGAGYREVRRPIYQLYYLLVHVNLFGASYVAACRTAIDELR